ncbi:hypothetical protein EJ377_03260 [Chryseobacterium arthrosphaerae]|uniref:Uncharacterized protein n=1 Tax=Chryseobacterium arthrosphaerae TaxID=651561 RepID=A0A3S0Q7A1_9FLAO|nr:hypothetical protein EJ377_03260 [Chryseobacterium arthrosphaerae]
MAEVSRLLAGNIDSRVVRKSPKIPVESLEASRQISGFQKSNEAAGLLNQEMAFMKWSWETIPMRYNM